MSYSALVKCKALRLSAQQVKTIHSSFIPVKYNS